MAVSAASLVAELKQVALELSTASTAVTDDVEAARGPSCITLHGKYIADILTCVDGQCFKSVELRTRAMLEPRADVYLVPTGGRNEACGVVDMGASVEVTAEELKSDEYMAKHRVPLAELESYLGARRSLHCIPLTNPRVLGQPVQLQRIKGVQMFRNLSERELEELRNVPMATDAQKRDLLGVLRLSLGALRTGKRRAARATEAAEATADTEAAEAAEATAGAEAAEATNGGRPPARVPAVKAEAKKRSRAAAGGSFSSSRPRRGGR